MDTDTDWEPSPEARRLQIALEMQEAGIAEYRQRMRDRHPGASEDEIRLRVAAWLAAPSTFPDFLETPEGAIGYLIAARVAGGSSEGLADLRLLMPMASGADLDIARHRVQRAQRRPVFTLGRDLPAELERHIADMGR